MRLFALSTAGLLASCVSARSINVNQPRAISTLDDDPLQVPGNNPLKYCEDPADNILKLSKVDLDPNPPAAGKNLTIDGSGELTEDIEDGAKAFLVVKYGVITLIRQEVDFCEQVKKVDLECPLSKDKPLDLSKIVELPKQIPPGKYTVNADVRTKDGDRITCLTAVVTFSRNPGLFGEWRENL